jgi:hypothetical protein
LEQNAISSILNPFFDRGKHGVLKQLNVILINRENRWFDELLNTQMKICRGSGVLVKVGNDWKISIMFFNDGTK